MSSIIRLIQNNYFTSAIVGGAIALAPALYIQAIENPYSFGAQIIGLGALLAGNYYFARQLQEHAIDFPIPEYGPLIDSAPLHAAPVLHHPEEQHHRTALNHDFPVPAYGPFIDIYPARLPSAPVLHHTDEQHRRSTLYPDLYSGDSFVPMQDAAQSAFQEIDPISQGPIDPEHRIELESGGVFDARQLFLATLSATKKIGFDGHAYLENPINRRPLSRNDIAALCDRFMIDPRRFLGLWDISSEVVDEGLLSTADNREDVLITQEDIIGNAERTFRTENAIQLVRQNLPEKAHQLLSILIS